MSKKKKLKVEIPEGYEVESVKSYDPYDNQGNRWKEAHIKFKPIKKELPKTWGEYYHSNQNDVRWLMEMDKYQDEFVALYKLILLRDHYNDGWVPDYNSGDQPKYIINVCNTIIQLTTSELSSHILAFKTVELRDRFYQYFKGLIEQSKPLL